MEILHNPRCSKSRQALSLVREHTQDILVVEYLKNPLTKEELKGILIKLGIPASALVRKSEAIFKEHFKGKELTEEEWVNALVEYPKLIERPILINGNKAVIGRPPEKVLEIL